MNCGYLNAYKKVMNKTKEFRLFGFSIQMCTKIVCHFQDPISSSFQKD